MTKSLSNMSESERKSAITRRLAQGQHGLGYWAAYDAQHNAAQRSEKLSKELALQAAKRAQDTGLA